MQGRSDGLADSLVAKRAELFDAFFVAAALDVTKKGASDGSDDEDDSDETIETLEDLVDDEPALSAAAYLKAKDALFEFDDHAYVDSIYSKTSDIAEVAWNDARSLLAIDSGFEVLPQWTLDKLQQNALDFSFLAAQHDRETLSNILESAFLNGSSAKTTATAMRQAFSDGISIKDSETGEISKTIPADSYFKTVARTELQDGLVTGQLALYKAAAIATVRWQAAEPCDECEEYDDQVYPIDDIPDGGPPLHPNCRCILSPADEDLGSHRGSDDERAAARRGNQPAEEDDDEE